MAKSFDHISAVAVNAGKNEDYSYTYALILAGIIDANHDIDDFDDDQIIEALDNIAEKVSNDFWFEFDSNEYRVIHADSIWGIYEEEIKSIVTQCYDLKLDKIPDFIAVSIDWEQTAHNAYVDGYGHTFAGYDGEEIEIIGNRDVLYHVFRTN